MDISKTLHDTFGFKQFLPGQEEVIRRVVRGRSCLAVFPTGQGKSLCYQLSSLHLPGLTLVVSPLVALMKDQVDFLLSRSIKAARLDSSLTSEEFAAVQSDLAGQRLKILYVAPERFANERFLTALKRQKISLMVVDEAHCISEWGHNFRPDYLKLPVIGNNLKIPTRLCLTATAVPKVADNILTAFAIDWEDFIHTGFYRANLTLRFSPSADPLKILRRRLEERPLASAIVYVTLQATAEKVAEALCAFGFPARAYHAGMKDETRHEVQEWFMGAEKAIVVATIAFGMGIDKADIRCVYHYNLPKSLENYAQEIGRAGRDGKTAVCEVLGGSRDLTVLENFVYADTLEPEALHGLLADINGQDEIFDLSAYELSHIYDMRPLVINTFLIYLELEKIIEATGHFYTTYKLMPHRSSAEIFARFDAERIHFLQGVFSCAIPAKKWFSLDLAEVMARTGAPRERIVTALNYLEQSGDITLQVKGVRNGFRLLRRLGPDEFDKMGEELGNRFLVREKNDIKRIHQVVDLVNHRDCRTNYLLDYFGEKRETGCGHCESCLGGAEAETGGQEDVLIQSRPHHLDDRYTGQINKVIGENHKALQSVRQQARFFCGIRSPQAVRAGLHRDAAFGLLNKIPFPFVLQWLEENQPA